MVYETIIFVYYRKGIYYVGHHGGESSFPEYTAGKAFTDRIDALEYAIFLEAKYHPSCGIVTFCLPTPTVGGGTHN